MNSILLDHETFTMKFQVLNILCTFIVRQLMAENNNDCYIILNSNNTKVDDWSYLKECLIIINGSGNVSKNISENIWRLIKMAFDDIEYIPPDAYKYMGESLIFIPLEDLRNVSLDNIEIVESFGRIKMMKMQQQANQQTKGFSEEQLKLLAQKIHAEWTGKMPNTYSEYDLRAMGEILCYFNTTDIKRIHADAYKEAAEWIGSIENCPMESLRAFAQLAKSPDAFGEPYKWSTLEVSIIGNVINGLTQNEINTIDKHKLQLNHFYRKSHNNNEKIYQEAEKK